MVKKDESTLPAVGSIAALEKNEELASMYRESAKVGSENLSSEAPVLKVHKTGKSTTNELANGSEPDDGYFFYKPTGTQFESMEAHILSISRGYRSKPMEGSTKTDQFNQIVSGMFLDEQGYKPFVMYFTGLKLAPMWEYGKIVSKFTKRPGFPIPMFALTTIMTTEKVKSKWGPNWIINFDYKKNEDGSPVLIEDPSEFEFLKGSVSLMEEQVEKIIQAKSLVATPVNTDDDWISQVPSGEEPR